MPRPKPPTGLAAVKVALQTTAAGAPRGRRLAGLIFLIGVPVLIQLIVVVAEETGGRGTGFTHFANLVTRGYFFIILPLTAILLGTGTFGDEWGSGTAHYVMGTPMPRYALVLGRWIANVRRIVVLIVPAILAVYVLALASFEGAWSHYSDALVWVLAAVGLLAVAYGALFLLFGLALKRSVTWAFVYVFVFEMLIGNLPQSFAWMSVGFHARNILWQLTGEESFRLPTADIGTVEPVAVTWSLFWIACATVGSLLLSSILLFMKECGGAAQASDAAET